MMHFVLRLADPDAEPRLSGFPQSEWLLRQKLAQTLGLLCDSAGFQLCFLDVGFRDVVIVLAEGANRVRIVVDRAIQTQDLVRLTRECLEDHARHLRAASFQGLLRSEGRPSGRVQFSSRRSDGAAWIQIYHSPETRPQ